MPSIYNSFDKIFVINLDTRKDRWEEIQQEFKKMGITNYERFSAVKPDFERIPPKMYQNLVSPHRHKQSYIVGAMGCKFSHYSIIQMSKQRGYQNILILEDDAMFITSDILNLDHEALLQDVLKEDYDMLYFGANHSIPPVKINNHFYEVKGALTTHAYAMKSTIFDYVLETMLGHSVEIDNYYITKVHQNPKIKTRCIKPALIIQRESFSDILGRKVDYKVIN